MKGLEGNNAAQSGNAWESASLRLGFRVNIPVMNALFPIITD